MNVERSALNAERSAPNGAVFLSYASQDAEAAQRICDALRASGAEVWFDQSDLVGGDAWDQKIRKQIKECALFIPVISENTQARREGYFRLEWKLAAHRTHTMADGTPFVVPVVIDPTRHTEALVPEEFRAVQWTRLPRGESTAHFIEQVKRLLGMSQGARASSPASPGFAGVTPEVPGNRATKVRAYALASGVTVVALAAVALWQPWRGEVPLVTLNSKSQTQNPQSGHVAADKSIAVLPFVNQSDDQDNTAFFADGVHEDILTSLANIRDLRVISRTSVLEYRGTIKKIPQIARELGVAYILEGSVRRAGNHVRITGQLIRAAADEHIWAKNYDRELTPKEVFAIQAELATEIAGALHAAISPATKKLLARLPTENLAAYDLYLKGRDPEESRRPGLESKAKHLAEAVALDPKFAEAWAALAATHAAFVYWEYDHTSKRLEQADVAIAHALRLAPDSPEVIYFLGRYALLGYRDFARASAQFQKIIELQPNNAEGYTSLAFVQRRQGRWREVLENFQKALELDPSNERRHQTLFNTLQTARRWEEARAVAQRFIARKSGAGSQTLARLAFKATGSTREGDEWLAQLPAAQLAVPGNVLNRKYWARVKGDYAEWKRLDALHPHTNPDIPLGRISLQSAAIDAAWMHAAHGDRQAARARLGNFPAETRSTLAEQPANTELWSELALMEALLEQPEPALLAARKALELLPESVDPLIAARSRRDLAIVCAWTGRKDEAITDITRLLRTPFGSIALSSVHELRVDPAFAPLRGDSRFEALLADPKNNAPLF